MNMKVQPTTACSNLVKGSQQACDDNGSTGDAPTLPAATVAEGLFTWLHHLKLVCSHSIGNHDSTHIASLTHE